MLTASSRNAESRRPSLRRGLIRSKAARLPRTTSTPASNCVGRIHRPGSPRARTSALTPCMRTACRCPRQRSRCARSGQASTSGQTLQNDAGRDRVVGASDLDAGVGERNVYSSSRGGRPRRARDIAKANGAAAPVRSIRSQMDFFNKRAATRRSGRAAAHRLHPPAPNSPAPVRKLL